MLGKRFTSRGWWIGLLAGLLAVLATPGAMRAERPPATKLLPETTAMMLSVADAPDMAERFMNTAMGQMSRDPRGSC